MLIERVLRALQDSWIDVLQTLLAMASIHSPLRTRVPAPGELNDYNV
jgi:hypothetical protein